MRRVQCVERDAGMFVETHRMLGKMRGQAGSQSQSSVGSLGLAGQDSFTGLCQNQRFSMKYGVDTYQIRSRTSFYCNMSVSSFSFWSNSC